MPKRYLPYEPDQPFLLPPSLREWLPEEHLALFVLDVVQTLDLKKLYRHYDRERRGAPPYHPRMMVTLLVYAYCVGVPSSRKIERRTQEDVAFRVLCANMHPNYKIISEFRRQHLSTLAELFVQVLKLCQRAGLVKLGHVSLDGTKMKANASKHKAMSYERMKEQQEKLEQKVQELLKAAEETDAEEDARYGKDQRGDELPEELRRAQGRLERIRELRRGLEEEAQQQAEAAEAAATEEAQVEAVLGEMDHIRAAQGARDDDDRSGPPAPPVAPGPLPSHKVPVDAQGVPEAKAQRNFTDGDSRIMKAGGDFIQGYNGQLIVDSEHQIIVAHGVSNQAPDCEHLAPMLDRVLANCGAMPEKLSADSGYLSEENLSRGAARGVDLYIAPGRTRHAPGTLPESQTETGAKVRMRDKLSTPAGKEVYSRRKVIVEPVFGQGKNRGFRGFLLRGLAKVRSEWALIALSHNLLKLHGARLAHP